MPAAAAVTHGCRTTPAATGIPAFLEAVTFLAVLATAAFSIAERRTWRLGAVIFAVSTILLWSLHVFVGSVLLDILRFCFGVGFLGYVIAVLLIFCLLPSACLREHLVCSHMRLPPSGCPLGIGVFGHSLRLYIVNYQAGDASPVGEALKEFFPGESPPAGTWIGVSALASEDFMIEIEAVAVVEYHAVP
jgi:hypothetical protein